MKSCFPLWQCPLPLLPDSSATSLVSQVGASTLLLSSDLRGSSRNQDVGLGAGFSLEPHQISWEMLAFELKMSVTEENLFRKM